MTSPRPDSVDYNELSKLLAIANKLSAKAYQAKNLEEFGFIVLNDTIQLIRYDRAFLCELSKGNMKILGASGHTKVDKTSKFIEKMNNLSKNIHEPNKPQILESDIFTFDDTPIDVKSQDMRMSITWIPIKTNQKMTLGLWLENWISKDTSRQQAKLPINVLIDHVVPTYASVWERLSEKFTLKKLTGISRQKFSWILLAFLLGTVFIRIPLRIVAPCEVVPKDPYVVTAPLEGIIEQIVVKPGEFVSKGTLLFEYDKRVPLQQLKVAEKNVEITRADVSRTESLGLSKNESLKDLSVLKLKLEKETLEKNLAQYQASRLTVSAPIAGIIMINHPDEWRGKPVKVGERVLSINNHENTKVRIWLPEDDNIHLDLNQTIKVFLNINPEASIPAKLTYIADSSIITDKQVPSFEAEAEWIEQPKDIKLGLKGTAVLYGEKVSLIYYVFRKPIAAFRNFFGV